MADIIQRVIDASARGDLYAALGVAPLPKQGDSAVDALRRCTVLRDLPHASIKSAYVSVSLACHPDKCKHEKATDAQTAVNKAWEILRDSASRATYDASFRAMIQRENEARQREEMRKQRQAQPAITPKMFQQQKCEDDKKAGKKADAESSQKDEQNAETESKNPTKPESKKETDSKAKGAAKEPTKEPPTSWEVGTSTLRAYKTLIQVKVSSSVTRKFVFKEWQDSKVAKQVAEEFAKSTLSTTNQFDCVKLKKDKVAFVQKQGVDCTGKETVIGSGKCKQVEAALRSCFQTAIGADTVGKAAQVVEGVTFNSFKNVFQASIKIDDQAYIKEFKTKSDAEHWVDIVKALKQKDLLKGHFATLKQAAATREATQKAFDSIVNAKNVFVPESEKTFQYDPATGKDVWSNMFSKFEDVPDDLPKSKVWLAQVSLQELMVQGFSSPVYADVLAWKHRLLGYRGIQLVTHQEHETAMNEVQECATHRDLTYVGFIRCISSSTDQPTLAPKDLEKLKHIASKNSGVGIAIIVTYPTKVGCMKAWEWKGGSAASSSSAVESGLQEVSVATIVRRVEGEKFTIEPLAPAPPAKTRFYTDIQSAFDKHVNEMPGIPKEDKYSFQRIPVLGDGYCFWHAYLRCTLVDEYNVCRDKTSGGPRSRDRLIIEIDNAKKLFGEFMSSSKLDFELGGPEVPLSQADQILRHLNTRFRITVSQKASVTNEDPTVTEDAYYGNPEAPVRGHMFFRWLTDPGTGKVNAGHYDLLTPGGGSIKLPQDAPLHFSPSNAEAAWDWGDGESIQGDQAGDTDKASEPKVVDPSGKVEPEKKDPSAEVKSEIGQDQTKEPESTGAMDTPMKGETEFGKDQKVDSEPTCSQNNQDTADTHNLFGDDSDSYWDKKEETENTASEIPINELSLDLLLPITKLLAIHTEWQDLIYSGKKVWELRNAAWQHTGDVGLWCDSKVWGKVTMTGCRLVALRNDDGEWEPFDSTDLAASLFPLSNENMEKHRVPFEQLNAMAKTWNRIYAYTFESPVKFSKPISIHVRKGARRILNMDPDDWRTAWHKQESKEPDDDEDGPIPISHTDAGDQKTIILCTMGMSDAFKLLESTTTLLLKSYNPVSTGRVHIAVTVPGTAFVVGSYELLEVKPLKNMKELEFLETAGWRHNLISSAAALQSLREKRPTFAWLIDNKEFEQPPLTWKTASCPNGSFNR
eukprot:s374_g55.t1